MINFLTEGIYYQLVGMFKGAALDSNQLNLFSDIPLEAATRSPTLVMDKPALVRWKSRIFDYQQRVRESQSVQQTTLFDLTPTHCDPGTVNPFSLQLQSMAFWRFPANGPGESCIYFVIDSAAPLLLYVGVPCRSNKRWKGTHDCKRYIEKYHELHYQHQLSSSVNMAGVGCSSRY